MTDEGIPDIQLANNSSQRLPCVLLLDGSGSMAGAPIAELNAGLRLLEEELKKDDVAGERVQLLVIQFGGDNQIELLSDWTDAMSFEAPEVTAGGLTPMGEAVRVAMSKIEEQKANYRTNGIAYNRPWIFLITDGGPTDPDWEQAAALSHAAEEAGKLIFFGIGVGPEAKLEALAKFSKRAPVRLQGLKFRELFLWLSRSTSSASKATQGTSIQLALPADWLEVSA
jgi:uncharacterized protein YegL